MNALELGLANNKLRNLASIQGQLTTKVSVPTITSQAPTYALSRPETGITTNPVLMWNAITKPANTPSSTSTYPAPDLVAVSKKIVEHNASTDTDLVKEIKARLAKPNFGLVSAQERQKAWDEKNLKTHQDLVGQMKKAQAEEETNAPDEGIYHFTERERLKAKAKKMAEESAKQVEQQAQEPAQMLIPDKFNNLSDLVSTVSSEADIAMVNQDKQRAIDIVNQISTMTDEEFKAFLEGNRNKIRIALNLAPKLTNNPFFRIPTGAKSGSTKGLTGLTSRFNEDSIRKAVSLRKTNPEDFKQRMIDFVNESFGVSGSGLRGGALVKPYYQKNAPNFGNLFLNEKELKRGNLSISQPFSKSYVLHQKNISPLLKKMILDIANTLEFDKQDYYNLDGEEKRVIEKIIRAQKDMKEYNIKKLIDDDDYKMKKRLQILVGQINAGNQSHLVKEEMRQLLKNLFDNRAISLYKYQQAIKSLEAL